MRRTGRSGAARPLCLVALSVLFFCSYAQAQAPEGAALHPDFALPPALEALSRPAPLIPPALTDPLERRQAWLAALARRLDAREGISASTRWRTIMAWPSGEALDDVRRGRLEATDEAARRYTVAGGRGDPALDFAASVALALTHERFSCAFPLRARELLRRGILRDLALDAGRCEGFEAWADMAHVDGVEVLFASPSWADVAASAGHVMFRIRMKPGSPQAAPSLERVLGYAVNTDALPDQEHRIWRGLTGVWSGELMEDPSAKIVTKYTLLEQRDLRVYDLQLSPQELRDLLALFYVQRQHQSRFAYLFLSANCGSMAYDAIRAVLAELPLPPDWFDHPHELLSVLLRAGRLTPRGVQPSRRSRARAAEFEQERLSPSLAALDGFDALRDARDLPPPERLDALRRFRAQLNADALDATTRLHLAAFFDGWIEIESHSIDMQQRRLDDSTSSPTLDGLLDIRSELPIRPTPRLEPPAPSTILPGGSRRVTARTGVGRGLLPIASLRIGILDEQPGEPRQAGLRPESRYEFMVSDTRVRFTDLDRAEVEAARVSIFSTATWGNEPEQIAGWLPARLGFGFNLEAASLPTQRIPAGLSLRLAPGLTLLRTEDFTGHLVLGVDALASAWWDRASALRGTAGAWVEVSAPLSDEGGSRLRLTGRLAPGWAWEGPALEADARASIDWLLSGRLGVLLGPWAAARLGAVEADGWEAGIALSW